MYEVTPHYGNHHLFLNLSKNAFSFLLQIYWIFLLLTSFFLLQALQNNHFLFIDFLTAKLEYYTATYLRNQKKLSKKCKKSGTTQIGCAEITIFASLSS